jgi:hypothetical protein
MLSYVKKIMIKHQNGKNPGPERAFGGVIYS